MSRRYLNTLYPHLRDSKQRPGSSPPATLRPGSHLPFPREQSQWSANTVVSNPLLLYRTSTPRKGWLDAWLSNDKWKVLQVEFRRVSGGWILALLTCWQTHRHWSFEERQGRDVEKTMEAVGGRQLSHEALWSTTVVAVSHHQCPLDQCFRQRHPLNQIAVAVAEVLHGVPCQHHHGCCYCCCCSVATSVQYRMKSYWPSWWWWYEKKNASEQKMKSPLLSYTCWYLVMGDRLG